ncbi:unnamed protein product [Rotaria socialis]|uniref:FAD-binding PCMH-type domain-containing protein n=1 Tax=Rotaria socialis TaxID=392032 RepID=A0A820J632_9BILA|nr:unnamed protein product [Rotaria socialis]CAF4317040.1 unnamed protein product [Rotaria socialis]
MSNSACWPNASAWQKFNESIDGRLISVRPTAAFCAGSPPNMKVCNNARSQWTNSTWRTNQAGSMQNHNWENASCSSHLGSVTCTQGSVPLLGVNATTVEHVLATIRLTSANNLRLVIKSTGHDYLGRSTAADSLLLWVHHMKNMSLLEQYKLCTGESISNAIRLDAGVQWGEVYSWLANYKLIAIGGISSTVGAIGGFLQGGGHGPLSRWKGMAADHVLEFDVVTADGQRRILNTCQNQDLFWALRGGGGQSFAVVISAVLRTFPSPSMVSTIYNISATNEIRYSRLIRDFIRFLPTLANVGYSGYFYMTDLNLNIQFFVPNGNFSLVTSIFNQFNNNNTDLQFTTNSTSLFPTFNDYFSYRTKLSGSSGDHVLFGSRLIPEAIVHQQPNRLADILVQIRGRSKTQSMIRGHFVAGGEVSKISVNNSINPAWRTALMQIIFSQGWHENTSVTEQALLALHLRTQIELLQTVAGGILSSCYLNEADPNEPHWQQKFFGTQAHYNRLKSIKKAVDPNGLFICKNCVGSDDWSSDLNCPKASIANRIHIVSFAFFVVAIVQLFQ